MGTSSRFSTWFAQKESLLPSFAQYEKVVRNGSRIKKYFIPELGPRVGQFVSFF